MPKISVSTPPIVADIVALDTEVTGLDIRHGARPFFVTTCTPEGEQRYWEWDVDPITRKVSIPKDDIRDIAALVGPIGPPLVLQNGKFDAAALAAIGALFGNWGSIDDTLIAGHLLHSGQPHDLTSMALMMLGEDIQPYEDEMEDACNAARRLCRSKLPEWRIAKEGLPEMPSAKSGSKRTKRGVESESPWKADCWLPRAVARYYGYKDDHPWHTVLARYANKDSETTLRLWLAQREEIKRRGLWEIYQHRLQILPVVADMESRGVTCSSARLRELQGEYFDEVERLGQLCVNIAAGKGHQLELPKGASPNGSLRTFCFDVLNLERIYGKKSKTAAPTLDKDAMQHYKATLDPEQDDGKFINSLLTKRKLDTSLAYMESYAKFGTPHAIYPEFMALFPSANPTGSDTLRWTMSNPNGQQVSKQEQEGEKGHRTLRWIFGPLPGREWWACDYENIELRIPAYEADERVMIDLFERPDDPPYFGSNHALVAHKLWPREFEKSGDGKRFKEAYKSTLYQWTKNGNFAVQYGAQKETADRSYHKSGAFEIVQATFPKMSALNAKYIAFADKHGYVETLPDKTVDERRGYPIECSRSEWGRISPTVPFNYHVQSTAMWCTTKAMIRCAPYLATWTRQTGKDHFIALQVHDEIVFDFPAGGRRNLPKVMKLKSLMEMSGSDIGVPLKVSVSWHPRNWGEAIDHAESR